MKPLLEEYWAGEARHHWTAAAQRLGVPWPDNGLRDYPWTVEGLQSYLLAVGVRYFTAREATTPHQPWPVALLPPREAWLGLCVLGLVADKMREAAGRAVEMRNWWRPEDYNREAAHGAAGSDHLWAAAVDLDFTGGRLRAIFARRAALRMLPDLLQPKLLSVGVGWTCLHVGFAAPLTLQVGPRRWKYGTLPKEEVL